MIWAEESTADTIRATTIRADPITKRDIVEMWLTLKKIGFTSQSYALVGVDNMVSDQ